MSARRLVLEDVWKAYPRRRAGTRTMRALVARRVPLLDRRGDPHWALQGVSLEVGAGESVGLIGQNGAGKSTLLRLAAGVGVPTRGTIDASGRVAAVLSLGDTFAPDLTGRENAHTAAMVAGMRGAQARSAVDAAIEFAELEEYGGAPLRTYSSGMRLRLAFGVVAQLSPDTLLVDEVLAVGDLPFQDKCRAHIRGLRERGTTVVLASHDLGQVASECERAVWLQAGSVRAAGAAADVVAEYRDAMRSETLERTPAQAGEGAGELELRRNRFGTQEVVIESVALSSASIETGGALTVRLTLRSPGGGTFTPHVGVAIHRAGDGVVCYDVSSDGDSFSVGDVGGEPRVVELELERLDLLPGEYVLDAGVYEPNWEFAYDFHWNAYPLRVTGRAGDKGVFRPPHRWSAS